MKLISVRGWSVVVAALAALTYAATLGYDFVWDDRISVQRWLPAFTHWWSPFFPPADIPQFPYNYYRPLQWLSYRFDRAIAAGAPWPFHLTVVVLHVLATVLVFRAGLRLFEGYAGARQAALWASVAFAVHPIHSESVAWMGARPDVMVACLGLAALLAYQPRGDVQRSCIAAGLIFLALLCKENAIVLLLLVPAATLVSQPPESRRRGRGGSAQSPAASSAILMLPFAVAGVAYLLLRFAAIPSAEGPEMPAEPLPAFIGAIGTYLRLLVFPYPQNAYIGDIPNDDTALVLNVAILLVYAALLWMAWRGNQRALLYSLVWIAVTLAPSLAVINMPPTAPIAERYLYVPSIGFCWAFGLAVTVAAEHGRRSRTAALVAAVILTVVACVLTVNRNRVWSDNYTSWKDAAEKNTIDGLPMRNLAAAAMARNEDVEARQLFQKALELRNDPRGKSLIYNNLGTVALNLGDVDAAESYYRKALETEVRPDSLYNLGLLLLRRAIDPKATADSATRLDKLRQARDSLERALAASPYDADIYIALAHVAESSGDMAEARRRFEQALELGLPEATAAAVRSRMERAK